MAGSQKQQISLTSSHLLSWPKIWSFCAWSVWIFVPSRALHTFRWLSRISGRVYMLRELARVNAFDSLSMIRNYADIPSTNMVRPSLRGNLQLPAKKWEVFYRFEIFSNEYSKNFRQRKQSSKRAVTLDTVSERRTERCPQRFRPADRFLRFPDFRSRLSLGTSGIQGEKCRPLNHMWQIQRTDIKMKLNI